MTKEELDAIRDRIAGLPAGPWTLEQSGLWSETLQARIIWATLDRQGNLFVGWLDEVAEFVPLARDDISALLAEVDRLRLRLEKVTKTWGLDYPDPNKGACMYCSGGWELVEGRGWIPKHLLRCLHRQAEMLFHDAEVSDMTIATEMAAKQNGFQDLREFFRLTATAPMRTYEQQVRFKAWQRNDGTKWGLLHLCEEAQQEEESE